MRSVLAAAQEGRFLIEDFVPFADSIEFIRGGGQVCRQVICPLFVALMPQSGLDEKFAGQGERAIIDNEIKLLSRNIEAQGKDKKLLLMTLLLQRGEFTRVIRLYEADMKDSGDYYLKMSYLQALVGKKMYGDAVALLAKIRDEYEIRSISARRNYYSGLEALEKREADLAWGFFDRAVREDVTFAMPCLYLGKLASNRDEGLLWNARALSLVQPDNEVAKKARRQLLEFLK